MALPKGWLLFKMNSCLIVLLFFLSPVIYAVRTGTDGLGVDSRQQMKTMNTCRPTPMQVSIDDICTPPAFAESTTRTLSRICNTLKDVAQYLCDNDVSTIEIDLNANQTMDKCGYADSLHRLHALHPRIHEMFLAADNLTGNESIDECRRICGSSSRNAVICNAVFVGVQILTKNATQSVVANLHIQNVTSPKDTDQTNKTSSSPPTSTSLGTVSDVVTTGKAGTTSKAVTLMGTLNATIEHLFPSSALTTPLDDKSTSNVSQVTTANATSQLPPNATTTTTVNMQASKVNVSQQVSTTNKTTTTTVNLTTHLTSVKPPVTVRPTPAMANDSSINVRPPSVPGAAKVEAAVQEDGDEEGDRETEAELESPTGLNQDQAGKNVKEEDPDGYDDDDGEQEEPEQKVEIVRIGGAAEMEFDDRLDARPKGHAIGTFSSGYSDDADSHFFIYFLSVVVLCIAMYLLFHNKHKILAIIVEGRQDGRRRRPNSNLYRKLDNNLEEVIQDRPKNGRSNVIY